MLGVKNRTWTILDNVSCVTTHNSAVEIFYNGSQWGVYDFTILEIGDFFLE